MATNPTSEELSMTQRIEIQAKLIKVNGGPKTNEQQLFYTLYGYDERRKRLIDKLNIDKHNLEMRLKASENNLRIMEKRFESETKQNDKLQKDRKVISEYGLQANQSSEDFKIFVEQVWSMRKFQRRKSTSKVRQKIERLVDDLIYILCPELKEKG